MLSRSRDVERANYLINHPAIRPFVGGDGETELDLRDNIANDANFLLVGDFGGFLCTWSAPRIWEVHTFIIPAGRGRWARDAAIEGQAMMRAEGAEMLWTRVDPDMANVRNFTLSVGFKPDGQHFHAGQTWDIFTRRLECQ